ncbi:MAG TPA: tRNA (adenosine(37)-N6)-threonylcarbamoyltransferase complex dimerization subunit type 1 TsaB [Solirubrobacteraceae bacterium]|jgi:tRNA threonylcarbamoyladenosine biosynthesis protein TsaB|nr:tRNA (adenosine(37)-N6)-threonylcarbamoyltransferase complex dimerization subunit type 1 TsaB [Solirubrobacteraceae bacterium]
MTAVLGFDTATHATVVGLRLADGTTLQRLDDPPAEAHPGHATRLLAIAAELLAQADLRWSALGRIAVGVGPGRFTGLRVGIATARGLSQSLACELVGVSTLQTLALGAARRASTEAPGRGTIAVIDARRGEAFAAAYQPDGAELSFAHALGPLELERIGVELAQHGVAARAWQAVGDGALRFEAELRAAGIEVAAAGSPLHALDAAALCELGARADPAVRLETVLPDYRRAPDAALARRGRPTLAVGPASASPREPLSRGAAS